jgi:hypothetical protein
MSRYDEIMEKIKTLQAEAKEESRKLFHELAKEFFDTHPNVNSFGWRQYTPYFNDGDVCEFSVHASPDYGITINDVSADDDESLPEFPSSREPNYQQKRIEYNLARDQALHDYKAASEVVNKIDDDLMKELFGDHVTVTVFRDGTCKVNDYEHD